MATHDKRRTELVDMENPALPAFEAEVEAMREAAQKREAERLTGRRKRQREYARNYRARKRWERWRLLRA